MSNIFVHKQTKQEVSLVHIGKLESTKESMAVYEKDADRTIWMMPLGEFNHDYEQHDYSEHDHFTKN